MCARIVEHSAYEHVSLWHAYLTCPVLSPKISTRPSPHGHLYRSVCWFATCTIGWIREAQQLVKIQVVYMSVS